MFGYLLVIALLLSVFLIGCTIYYTTYYYIKLTFGYVKICTTKLKKENNESEINLTARLRSHPHPEGLGLLAVPPHSLKKIKS
jgi:hypothetical protein